MAPDAIDSSLYDRSEFLLTLLERDWQSYASLAAEMDKHERTLRRALRRLQRSGYQIESRWDGKKKVFRLEPGTRRKPIEPGILEVLAANLGRGLLGFLQGTELRDQMEGLFDQLIRSSRASARQLRHLDKKFWFMPDAPRHYKGCDELLNEIITCLIDQKEAEIVYRGRGQKSERLLVHPYTLIVRRECLYVMAGVAGSSSRIPIVPRLFDLTRITEIRRLRATFDFPKDWEPASVFHESFGVFIPRDNELSASDVRIWFDAGVAQMIRRRRWHETQHWAVAPQGGWYLDMRVRICPELVHWTLGFGPAARVVRPRALKAAVVDELAQALDAYRKIDT